MSDEYIPDHGDDSFDVTHYALGLGYKLIGNRLDGDAVLSCVALVDTTAVTLDLAGLRVAKVFLDGKPTRFTHRGSRLRITARLAAEQEFELRVKYAGSPGVLKARDLDDAGWEELTDGVIVAAQPHGAPTWFPCNDRPSNKATYADHDGRPERLLRRDVRAPGRASAAAGPSRSGPGRCRSRWRRTSRPCRSVATRSATSASMWS